MTSTSITRIGKVTVVTQVIGSDEDSIQLQNPPPATQAPVSLPEPTPAWTPTKTDKINPYILQGEPQCLGVRWCLHLEAASSADMIDMMILI